jgi:hypothetical protein
VEHYYHRNIIGCGLWKVVMEEERGRGKEDHCPREIQLFDVSVVRTGI